MARGLPAEDQLAIVYQDLTGKELPLVAYEAVQVVEAQKARNAASEMNTMGSLQNSPVEPSAASGCTDKDSRGYYFLYDCYVYGGISRTEYADDVCLLVAAIKGDVRMSISYWKAYLLNYAKTVPQGYYTLKSHRTAVDRYRKGRLYDAKSSEYSRFYFQGDFENETFASDGWCFSMVN